LFGSIFYSHLIFKYKVSPVLFIIKFHQYDNKLFNLIMIYSSCNSRKYIYFSLLNYLDLFSFLIDLLLIIVYYSALQIFLIMYLLFYLDVAYIFFIICFFFQYKMLYILRIILIYFFSFNITFLLFIKGIMANLNFSLLYL
jgi:hypothetical protein